MANTTAKFQLQVPLLLASASPALAALHASRFIDLNKDDRLLLEETHCLKCGSPLANGTLSVRTKRTRKKRTKGARGLYMRHCTICQSDHNQPWELNRAPRYDRRRNTNAILNKPMASDPPIASEQPTPLTLQSKTLETVPISTSVALTSTSNSRPETSVEPSPIGDKKAARPKKKKTALQQMLDKSREKEKLHSQSQAKLQKSGLSAFLDSL